MIVLTGGKTGGHIMPLLALSKKLDSVCYIGCKDSLEERLCQEHQISFIGMHLKNNHIFSIIQCFFKLKLKKVECIISTGGYVSFPVLLYGIFHRIPIYILEENVIMGRTNRFFVPFAKKVFLTYPLKKMKKKYKVVGLPTLVKEKGISPLEFNPEILIIGGSLGSKPICELAEILKEHYKVCLIAGRFYKDYDQLEGVKVLDYVFDLPSLMRQSKLIISRAGAATTYEIFTVGKPCILVPSQNTSQNHQYLNALYFENKGCCKLLKEENAKEEVVDYVKSLLDTPEARFSMVTNQRHIVLLNSCEIIRKEIGI